MSKRRFLADILLMITFIVFLSGYLPYSYGARCGNGIKEGAEECDNGQNNSDSNPNACRTDCTLHWCGDYVTDSGEECDKGPKNNDDMPGACRMNCKKAYCGDGVLDLSNGERCDDKNNNPYDGCHNCQECYLPKDDLIITSGMGGEVRLCPGTYEFEDKGQEGIIIIQGQGVRLNCEGVTLVSKEPTLDSAIQSSGIGSRIKNLAGVRSSIRSRRKSKRQSQTNTSSQQNSPGYTMPKRYTGTAIVVKGQDAVVHDCKAQGFKTGIKVDNTGVVLFGNQLCDNQKGVVALKQGSYGVKNSCANCDNWQEAGKEGCTLSCP